MLWAKILEKQGEVRGILDSDFEKLCVLSSWYS